MSIPLLDTQRQIELIRSGAYSQKPKIQLPTKVRPQINNTPVQQPQTQTAQSSGYDPKKLFTYPVYRGASIALERIDSFFEGKLSAADAMTTNPYARSAAHFGVGFVEFFPTAFMSSAMVIPASEYIIREPSRAAQTFVPAQVAMVGQIRDSAVADPARFAGSAAGMAIGFKGAAKIAGKGIGNVKKISPYYEKGMRVYSGKPNVAEVITGKQRIGEYHYTLEGRPEQVYNPKLAFETHRYYHGTQRDFMGHIASAGQKGVTVNPQGVHSRGVSGLEEALYFGAPETGYGHFVPGRGGAFIKLETTVRPLSRTTRSILESRGPGKMAGNKLMKEYYSAPRGELIAGVKPGMNIKYAGWQEWEYMLKPGTKLYPTQNLRTRAYGLVGMRRGTSFTVDPITGRNIEILKVTTKKPRVSRVTRAREEFSPKGTVKSDPFADVVGRSPAGRTRKPIGRMFPDEGRGRNSPYGRDIARQGMSRRAGDAMISERGTTPRTRGTDRQPTRREYRDVTGIRAASYRGPDRGTVSRRDSRARGDTQRTPERPFLPERNGRFIPTQFIQISETKVRRRRDNKQTRTERPSGQWDSYAYSEFLTNMPVNEFLGW